MDALISRRLAVGIVATQGIAHIIITSKALRKQNQMANAVIADQNLTIDILKETVDFLLDRADGATVAELNKNLDFWRVVRGVPTED